MLRYLVIILDDSCPSFCHYTDKNKGSRLISLKDLRQGIVFGMKNNLNLQIVFPDARLPEEYYQLLSLADYSSVVSSSSSNKEKGSIVVFNDVKELADSALDDKCVYVLTLSKESLFSNVETISSSLGRVARLNVFISDICDFVDQDIARYKDALEVLSSRIVSLFKEGNQPQLNLLTDRIILSDAMNNCGAGDSTITLAPDGNYYICPAFYYDRDSLGRIGDAEHGANIPNKYLYEIDNAPICRICDAYQCKRCIWMNVKSTHEVNTPGHEQCVVSHLERNASRNILIELKSLGLAGTNSVINEIDYLDPFEHYILK